MKMIYLANARIPTEKAHGLQIMKMCEVFKNQGNNIELVVAKRKNNQLERQDPFKYYGLKVKFPIKKLPLIDLVDYGRSLKGFSVPIQNISFALFAFFHLWRKKTDLIYSRDEFSLFFLCFFKKNLVLEFHNFPNSKLFLYKFIFKRVRKIVVITNRLKKLIVDLGINKNKIIVCPDGVDLEYFDIKESKEDCRGKLNLSVKRNIILYTGHLFAWKGIYTLVEASKFLTDKELIVVVGGMEYDQNKIKEYIDKNKLKNILLIKHQPPTEIPYYLKAADVVTLPNSGQKKISIHYTSPIKLFEYMAAKKPIVASDLPSIREVLNPANATLVPPDVAYDLAQGIKKVLTDAEFSEMIVTQAFAEVKKYTWQKRAEKILNFIK